MIGRLVANRFELIEQAGAGGMGAVWKARDAHRGDFVAVKLLTSAAASDADRFVREASVLAELEHESIVRYVDHGRTDDDRWYLAMEWLEGTDLAVVLSTGRTVSVRNTIVLAKQVASALDAAHRRGIVHRDVKPSNLFLVGGDFERVKVLDFGIARLSKLGARALTRTGVSVGTPGYMSPEQARGSRVIDARADVFALGSVLFECLAGRPAFTAEHIVGILAKILFEEVPGLSVVRNDVPPQLEALVVQMLAKDPAGRPADGGEVLSLLAGLDDAVKDDRPPSKPPAEVLTRAEQRVVSVVLAAASDRTATATPASPAAGLEVTQPTPSPGRDLQRLADLARAHGAHLEVLADGSVVATLSGSGTPTEQAMHAARCALAMRELLPGVAIVLATGRGVVEGRLLVGEVIDRAVRALRLADPEAVRLDETTAGLLDTRFDVVAASGGRYLRGERADGDATRVLLGVPTPYVGRERELALLEATWDQCIEDRTACAVLVTGAAGIGKSRLRSELVRKLRDRGDLAILHARAESVRVGRTFGMLAGAIRRTARILEGEPLEVQQKKLRDRVARHVPAKDVAEVTAFVGELAGVPFDDREDPKLRTARLDPVVMSDQMRRAWEKLVAAETEAHPTLLVLDDLHWGDLPTVQFVEAALASCAERPLMVLALARPEVHDRFPSLWASRGFTEIRLRGLTKRASESLVRAVLGAGVEERRVAQIVERADGNAFHLEELIRAAAEGRGDSLPETILGMVEARLDALAPETRRVLRAASIFGRVFWRGGLRLLLGDAPSDEALYTHLDLLVGGELVIRRAGTVFPGETDYVFRHEIVRDAAYAMLTEEDRRLGHRLAASWLESKGERDALVLADHCERGGDPQRAVEWYCEAASQALEGNDLEATIARAERGVACGATGTALGELRLLQSEAYGWRMQFESAARCAGEAVERLDFGSVAWFRALGAQVFATAPLGWRDTMLTAARLMRDTRAIGREVVYRRVHAIGEALVHLVVAGEHALAEQLATVAEQEFRDHGIEDAVTSARLQFGRGFLSLVRGDLQDALHRHEQAIEEFTRGGALRESISARANLGLVLLELGQWARAEVALREARAEGEKLGLLFVGGMAHLYLAYIRVRRGVLDHGLVQALGAGPLTSEDRRMVGVARMFRGTMLAAAGDVATAESELRQSLELLEVSPPLRARAFATLARLLMETGRPREAHEAAAAGLELVEALGAVFAGETLVRLAFIETLEATGQHAAAAHETCDAWAALEARSAKIADPELRRSFLEDIPENALLRARAAAV